MGGGICVSDSPWKGLAAGGAAVRWNKPFLPVVLGVALLCSGCAFRRQAAGMAIEHNDFVAQTTNRQTVLNILRAREREPMHFTSFANIAGKVQAQGVLGLSTGVGGNFGSLGRTDTNTANSGPTGAPTSSTVTDTVVNTLNRGATNWTPQASITVNTGTDFQVAANASEEFYRGILGPLSSGIIIHYLRQGFPADLLSHLVIGRLEFYARIAAPGQEPVTVRLGEIRNSPDDARSAALFGAAMRCRQLAYEAKPVPASSLTVPLASLSGVAPEVLARLTAVSGPDGAISYQLATPARNDFSLVLARPERADCAATDALLAQWFREHAPAGTPLAAETSDSGAVAHPYTLSSDQTPQSTSAQSGTAERAISEGITGAGGLTVSNRRYFNHLLSGGYETELVVEITIRSVEGILYYLGEYVRDVDTSPMLWGANCGYCIPIIRIRPASEIGASDRFIDVNYRGRLYAVPIAGAHINDVSGRSSQVISLVQQLLNLHRSSRDLPFTPLLRVAN